jgi:uncharacterized protein
MSLTKAPVHLLTVNGVIALLDESHVHNHPMKEWFGPSGLQWALCPLTEAGVLRFLTRPKTGGMSMEGASLMLARLKEHAGYHDQPSSGDWHTLTAPFFKRLHGHKQITDAFLLGLAINDGLTLVTFDRTILHLAGEHLSHLRVLSEAQGK